LSKDPQRPLPEAGLSQLLARIQRGELKPEEALRQLPSRPDASRPSQAESAPEDDRPWPPVAVIGMSGRFPGAPDLDSYWANLERGIISVGPIPPERWPAEDHYHPDPRQPGKTNSRWGGFLDGIDQFDPLFFALSPREAELMDPQQRLFLLETWRALEEAGYGDIPLDKRASGVFVGCGPSDYLPNLYRHGVAPDALAFTGNSNPILAARIAFLLNLRGPALAVDTACSSSLVAVILACESLAAGTCELALAGGVSVFTTPQTHVLSGQAGMLSPTGRCHSFDARADGFVPAEGVGVVVLKRLDQALRDGDHIHGVIRACGLNQDGRSNGITAPSASSQTALIRDVYRRYGIAPAQIGLIEAHGTGTQLGDPIEVSALIDAYGPGPARDCVLGSVKANIGHASSAAGIAGLLKLLLCLKHKQRPPLAGFERLNPHIDLADSGFRLPDRAEPWPAAEGQPRLAALSSFGFSGTNAHVVISEAEPVVAAPPSRPGWRLYAVSGQDDAGFRRRCHDLAAWLDAHPEADPADLSYTLLLGRTHGRRRGAVVAPDLAALKAELRRWIEAVGCGDEGTASIASDAVRASPHPTEIQAILDRARIGGPESLSRADLDALAAAYRAGMKPAWPQLFSGQPRRLSLPTYPFDLRRYWIPAELCGTLPPEWSVHPLLDRPDLAASAGNGLVLEKTIPADWPLLADHRVLDRPTLPATAYLEMAFAAARWLAPGTPFAVADLVWTTPCQARQEAVRLRLRLERDGADYRCGFESDQGGHCRGRLVMREPAGAGPVDLARFLEACPQTVEGGEVRAFYARRGVSYGPGFQGLKRLRLGEGQLVGWLELPPGTRRGPGVYWLDPALADAALQAAAWLFARPDAAPEGLLLPHRLVRAEWRRPLTAKGVVCARVAGPLTLDLVILDEHGQVAAKLDGLALAQAVDRSHAPAWECRQRRSSVAEEGRWSGQGCVPTLERGNDQISAFLDGFDRLETWARARLWQALAGHLPDAAFDPDGWAETRAIRPKYRRLWQVLLGLLAESGYVAWRDDGSVVPLVQPVPAGDALQAERRQLTAAVPALAPFARLVWDCTAALWPTLAGATEITRVLFPTGSAEDVAGIYAGNPLADAYNETLARLAAALATQHRGAGPFRVLEIGAGTGSASAPVIAALEKLARPVEFHFSDISPAFVRQARERFPQPFVSCLVLDLESQDAPPRAAGFDLVIAANVVHATRSIARSLGRIKGLLAPGGALLLNEITARTAFGALTFGLTDGWWAFDEGEDRLAGSPLLDGPGWERALAAAGFQAVESHGADWCVGHALDHRVLLARTVGCAEVVGCGDEGTASFASDALRSSAHPTMALESIQHDPGMGVGHEYMPDLRTADPDADLRYVRRVLAGVLKAAPEAIQPDRSLEEYGVDSLVTQQIVSAFAADLGDLPATLVYECPTARKLATHLRDRCGPQLDAQHLRHRPADPFARAPAPAAAPVPQAEPPAAEPGAALDIAIVGLAGRYPLADDLDQFWENLKDGKDCVAEVPAGRWDWRPYYDPDPDAPGKTYTAQGGFLRDADRFDARFFRISPREADDMDPQERLFLETAWHCVEQAGYDPLNLGKEQAVGVFVGVMNANYSQLAAEAWQPGQRTGTRTAYWSIANRVSFCLDYRGPSLAVDTACSSSLTAIHLACHSLLRGECAVAVAGGVNLILHPAHLVCLADLRMLSPGGRCRSFGAGADGFVDGEGVGAVLLKPLRRALADGDAILGVVKGSALNSGGRTTGYTVPSPEAQGRVVAAALAQAGVDPGTIGYVEAHGTGTALGDPIELAGLRAAFGADATARAIGSVKSNIGHAEAAAGIAGLTKLLLQLRHRTLVPSLHAETLNPKLDLGAFRVVTRIEDWPPPADDHPRCAGLSSFGAGGANAHLVVQEAPAVPRAAPPLPGPFLLPFSARDAAALERLLGAYREWLGRQETGDPYWLQDVAYTLQQGRAALAERAALVVDTPAGLDAALSDLLAGKPGAGIHTRAAGGEGGLWQGKAGRAYLETALQEREWDALARLWTAGADIDWTPLWTGREARRRSLPLYPFARVRHWLKSSGAALSEPEAGPGPLGPLLPGDSLAEGLSFGLGIAPEAPILAQHRVAGRAVLPGVVSLILGLAAAGRAIPGHAHSLSEIQWLKPLALDADAPARLRLAQEGDGLRFELLQGGACHARGRCLDQSLEPEGLPDWAEVRARLTGWQDGQRIYAALRGLGIEHGPFYQVVARYAATEREALAELALTAEQRVPGETWQPALLDGALQTVAGIAGLERQALLPFRLGRAIFLRPPGERAWCHAERLEGWRFRVTLYGADGRPAVCFENLEARPSAMPMAADPLAKLFYVPQWVRLDPADCRFAEPPSSLALFFGRGQEDAAAALAAANPVQHVLRVAIGQAEPPANTPRLTDTAAWVSALAELPDPLQLVFFGPSPSDSLATDGGCLDLLALLQALADPSLAGREIHLLVLTRQALALWPDDPARNPQAAALHGMALAAAREFPDLAIACIDGDGTFADIALTGFEKTMVVGRACTHARHSEGSGSGEVGHGNTCPTYSVPPITLSPVALRGGHAYRRRLEPVRLPEAPSPYRQGGVYLIIGGAGGLGLALAGDLVRRFRAQVFLTGRSGLDETRRRAIAALDQGQGQVRYLRADATDPEAMSQALAQVEAAAGALHGVFHCALVLADRALRQMDAAAFRAALDPKLRSALVLDRCLEGRTLDFLAFFSSAQSFLGNAGQANYTAGCTFIDAWAAHLAQRRPYPVRVLNWGFWGETGAVATPGYARRLQAQSILPIATLEGLAAAERALASPLLQTVPFRAEPRFLEQAGIGTGSGLLARRPDYPASLPRIEAGSADAGALANIARGLPRLDRAAAELFSLGLIEAGLAAPGMMQAEDGFPEGLPSRFHPLFRAALPLLESFGLLRRGEGGLRWGAAPPPPDWDAIDRDCPELSAYTGLLRALAPAYAAILAGRLPPTDALFPEGSLSRVVGIYQGHALADGLNRLAAEAICRFVAECPAPRLRILEIGAGTGATSAALLAALKPYADRVRYVFSDVSPAFVKQARDAYAGRYPYARFEVRDITRTPASPAELGQYDAVVAANVLHATPDLRATLDHARMLLRPNGLLVLNEVTANSPYTTFTFGLVDGWWAFRDGLRLPGGPLLDRAGWRRVLVEQGFQGYAEGGFEGLGQHVMLAVCGPLAPNPVAPDANAVGCASRTPQAPTVAGGHGHMPTLQAPTGETPTSGREVQHSVERLIAAAMAETLEIDPAELAVDTPHAEFGLDSILGVEVVSRVNRAGGFELSATDVFNYPTIRELARHIVASRGLARPVLTPQPPLSGGLDAAPLSRGLDAIPLPGGLDATALPREVVTPSPDKGRAGEGFKDPDAIAIVGMACRFPGAPNLDAFWELLKEGRDAVRPIPPERWSLARWYDPDPKRPGKTYSQWAGWLDDYDHFDPAFFNISPREAELMDPQQRQFLMVAWHALEHAGYGDRGLARRRCGIVVGAGAGDYRNRLVADHFGSDGAFAFMGNSDAILAGRLAYFLDLKGPSLTLDTACSSSLVAVHLARESLLRGETDMVLAGGVTIQTTAQFHVLSAKAGMLSPTGRCRPFDAGADGIVPGEGVALVVLKRLEDALADGDRIHAVVAGSGVNQDGRTNGITAPSAPSQTDLIAGVYQRHGIDPDQIGYVEAHGTGTKLGDPIEVEALTSAFRRHTAREGYCGLGSVKSNIGHALAAAGVAGLMKAVLCLEHRARVPSLHFHELNPHIRLAGSPFAVCREMEDWPVPPGGVRHAAVSAFGFSGTNAHLVLREAPGMAEAAGPGRARLPLVLSAQTRPALLRRARDLAAWLREHPSTRLEDLAATLWLGRAHLSYRLAVVAGSSEEFGRWLERPGLESLVRRGKPRDDCPAVDITAGEAALARLAADQAAASDLDSVARAYLEGWPLAWNLMFQGVAFRRLALPLYPFDTTPYSVPSPDHAVDVGRACTHARHSDLSGSGDVGHGNTCPTYLHPLIDRNTSTLEVQRFAWRPDPAATFLDQHRVGGQPVFPAVAFLEQARAAGGLSLPEPPNLIRDLELLQVLACQARPAVHIRLVPDGAAARFEIVSEDGEGQTKLHARGGLCRAELPAPPPVPVQALWDQAAGRRGGESCYGGIRRLGIEHGPAYRLLAETARLDRLVLARLEPPSAPLADWLIQPFPTDAMLQAAAAYFADLADGPAVAWLPARIDTARIFAPGGAARWARLNLVQGDPATDDSVRVDADLLDDAGRTLLAVEGVVFRRALPRAAPVEAPARTAPSAADLRERLTAEVLAQVAEVLRVAPGDVDPDDDLSGYGFDSIGFTALAERLEARLGFALAPSVFFEYRSLGAFLDYLLGTQEPQLRRLYGETVGRGGEGTASPANDALRAPAHPTEPPVTRIPPRFIRATEAADEPIAIVGLAGRMPGSRDLDDFWQKLLAVECMVREIPPERWDWRAIFGDPAGERNKCNVRHGAFLDEVDRFDPLFFGISPREAEAMDPQQRLFLETAWHAIEDAGYRASALAGRKVGVFAGVANFDYNELWRARTGEINAHAATGTAHSIVPNRVSFLLDFKGPSEPVDTACSSGLVAVYRAMAAIRDGGCEMAVAGAVNVMLTPTLHIAFNQAGMLNPDGQCRTFDRDAAGYVRGEGVGAVVLKPLSRAEADGDTIHGVLLGGALCHGGHANSLTAPNPATQAELLVDAYRRSGVAVEQVSYIEAHGTGTRLGDPAEVSGLVNAFARLREQQGGRLLPESCGLGSVKTNIGHLETAAGIAGLLKILLAMRHGRLPGNAHFRDQNPYIKLDASPFYILRESRPWQPRGADGQPIPRIAGISSFGFGGAYAHLVLREAPARPAAAESVQDELFVFSAKSPNRLRALVEHWLDFARRQGNGVRLADAAHTSRIGREAHACRLVCWCGQWSILAEALAAFLAGEAHPALLAGGTVGNGVAQRMAADWLTGGDPDWQAIAPDHARRVSIPGYPFARESYWPPLNAQAPSPAAHPLAGTNQATLYSQKYAARLEPGFALLRDHRVAGHGLLPATAYLEWARAVGSQAVEQPIAALARITWQRPLRAGRQSLDIHALLEPEGEQVRFDLCSGSAEAPTLHAQGWLVLEAPALPTENLDLAAVLRRCPTRWPEERCYAFFAGLKLDYGPGFRVLREVALGEREALGRIQQAVADPAYGWQPALLDGMLQTGAALLAGHPQQGVLLPHALARFVAFKPLATAGWVHARLAGTPGPAGAVLDLDYYDEAGNPLARMEGLEVRPVVAALPEPAVEAAAEPGPVPLAFRRCWEERADGEGGAVHSVLVFDEEGALSLALADAGIACQSIEPAGDEALTVGMGTCPPCEDHGFWQNLAPRLESPRPDCLLAHFPDTSSPAHTLRVCAALLRGLGSTLARRQIRLILAYGYTPSGSPWPGLDGFARSATQEYPGLRVRVLGLEGDPARHAPGLAQELGREDFHARLGDSRWVAGLRALESASAQEPDLSGTTWLITGAGGALGRLVAEALAGRGCRLALTGRRAADESLQAFLANLGGRGVYHACDLAEADAVAGLVAAVRQKFGPVHGVVHAAGTTADALLARKTAAQMDAVLTAKLDAAYRLDAALADEPALRWFVLFGSLAGVTGNIGQADYAYANAGLAHFARWREGLRAAGQRHGSSLCLEWPYWRDGGMLLDGRTLALMERQTGLRPLPSPVGLELFFQALALEGGAVGYAYGDPARIAKLLGLSLPPVGWGEERTPTRRSLGNVGVPAPPQPTEAAPSGMSENELIRLIEDRLLDLASAILKIDKAQFDPEDPMDAYGFDSINLSSLAHELGEQYGIALLPATFFEYPTLRDFSGYLAREHRAPILAKLRPAAAIPEPAAAAPPPTPEPAPVPEPAPRRRAFRWSANAAPEPIAVVGMSASLPGADGPGEFWAALESGLDLVGEIPASRWDWRRWHGSPAEGKTPVKRAGFMRRVDGFDAAFFGISPKEAALMDPQHRLFLQAAWHAIEDSGHKPSDFNGRKLGLFVGVSSFDYQEILRSAPDGVHAHELTGNAHSILVNRVSYLLNLRGPSEPVDTACSSSLVAVHRAIRAIRAGECEAALVGGVNVLLSPLVQLAFAKAGMLSPDGRCKTFDAAADGYVRGEGVGALLLKPLSLAKRDGNPIDALILGSAVNHGGRAHHLVAPNPKAQAEVVAAAVADAGVDPRSIGYIEVHGTGTALGDPIEINGLKLAFAELLDKAGHAPPATPFCALGSVKTQIGHLEAAAGVAGLVKLLLCLRHGRLPGNSHLREANPQIRLEGSPFYLPKDAQDWQRPAIGGRTQPRRAGISSFGFGGVNAHVVLEEAPAVPAAGSAGRGPWVFPFSAKDEARLRALVEAFLDLDAAPDLAGMAYTLQTGREAMPRRLAVVAGSFEELRRKLRGHRDGVADPDVLRGDAADAGLLSSLLDEEEGENYLATLMKAGKFRKLARLWVAGLEVDWARAYPEAKPARVHLPGYPFADTRFWAVERSPWGEGSSTAETGVAEHPAGAAVAVASESEAEAESVAVEPAAPVADFLRERLARVAGFDPAALDPQADLEALGLDSILAMELLRDIEAAYGLRLFPSELAGHRSLSALAAYIERERDASPASPAGEVPVGRAGIPLPDISGTRPSASGMGTCPTYDAISNPPMVFLLSTPRAGSTLLRAMLMGHSRLFAPPELHLLPFADMAQRHHTLAHEGKSFLGEGLTQTLCCLDGWTPDAAKEQIAHWMAAETPIAAVYAHLRERLGDRVLIDKSPSYAQSVDALRRAEALEPAPRYIHLIRHPLAMADSFVRNRFHRLLGAGEAPWPLALNLWDGYNANLDEFLAGIPAGRVFRLHYEDLVAAPGVAMRGLCRWLGVDFEEALLDPYRDDRLTQGLHVQSLPIGDPNFHSHRAIEPALAKVPAEAWDHAALLGAAGLDRALRRGYCLDLEPAPLAPAQAAGLEGREQPIEELLIHHAVWPEAALDAAALAWAWRRVLRRHLVLGHAFRREEGVWKQRPMPDGEPVFAALESGGPEEDEGLETRLAETLRDMFDWNAGRMAGCGMSRRSDGTATVTLVVHHLVADGVSLALIGRDLIAAYREPSAFKPAVDDRYRRYAEAVQAAAPPLADLDAWRRQIATPCRLPLDGGGANLNAHEASLGRVLSLAELGLAAATPETRHLRLLAALLQAIADWTGQPRTVVALRRHGRSGPRAETFHDVAGWFACDIPVAVEVAADLEQTMADLSARLKQLPADEPGYLRLQLAGELPLLHQIAPLRFNYQPLGPRSPAGETHRLVTDADAPRHYLIDWIIRERGDSLEIIVRHAQDIHRPDTIAGLLDRWQHQLTPRSP
jgi:acyl transferase domain-containing protein/SAM-dependent methyltransferase